MLCAGQCTCYYDLYYLFSPESPTCCKAALFSSAGPLALARESLLVDSEPFFVLNSDVICNYPFKKLLQYHKDHGKEGTIVVSRYLS